MRANGRVHSHEAGSSTKMEANQVSSEREDTLADQAVTERHPCEEEGPMRAERTVTVSQTTLRDSIVDIPGLIEEVVTDLVTPKSHDGLKRTDTQLQAMLQGLINKTIDKNLDSVDFEGRILRKLEKQQCRAYKWQRRTMPCWTTRILLLRL